MEKPDILSTDIADHIKVAEMQAANTISSNAAKEIMLAKAKNPAKSIDELSDGKTQLSDEAEIQTIVTEVLSQNTKAAEDIKKGEMKAIGFLVGQVMAKSQGKANPQLAQDIIKKQLGL